VIHRHAGGRIVRVSSYVDAALLKRRRQEIIDRYGPWTANNIDLGQGVWTIGSGLESVGEARVGRVERLVSDWWNGDFDDLRVLDLACYEGAFSVALARRGAHVDAIEAREEHVQKARFAQEALDLTERLTIHQADVRNIHEVVEGGFDLVLCLGILYHLDADDAIDLAMALARSAPCALIETQVALRGPRRVESSGKEYRGRTYEEDTRQPGASVGNNTSFWPTKASLLNLLADAGFTSVVECLSPPIPVLQAYRDHILLLATRGQPVEGTRDFARWPESLPHAGHPAQGWRYSLAERWKRRRGKGLTEIFKKPPQSPLN
jgi:SAM-dependent methyltransferase